MVLTRRKHTSVTMAWCFPDETNAYADAILSQLRSTRAFAPALWPLEVANILLVGERRRRLTTAQSERFVALLGHLPIIVDAGSRERALSAVLALGRAHTLSAYDAAYLDLTMVHGLPLATIDQRLRDVAVARGIPLVTPNSDDGGVERRQ